MGKRFRMKVSEKKEDCLFIIITITFFSFCLIREALLTVLKQLEEGEWIKGVGDFKFGLNNQHMIINPMWILTPFYLVGLKEIMSYSGIVQ